MADRHAVLFAIGDQLVPDLLSKAAGDDAAALRLVKEVLAKQTTVIVFDNIESILPPALAPMAEILDLARELSESGETRLIFTSRQSLPSLSQQTCKEPDGLGALPEAIRLVGQVLGEGNQMPHAADAVASEREIESLVDAVACHARALVRLVQQVVESGVAGTLPARSTS